MNSLKLPTARRRKISLRIPGKTVRGAQGALSAMEPPASQTSGEAPRGGARARIQFKALDVRPLLAQGIEPSDEIRRRVDTLGGGTGLSLVAPFLPAPLIEKLRSEGFLSRVERRMDGAWTVYFWRDTGG